MTRTFIVVYKNNIIKIDVNDEIPNGLVQNFQPIVGKINGNERLIFRSELESLVPVAASTRRRWEAEDKFPRHVKMGNRRGPNRIAWLASEIEAWIGAKIAERDAEVTAGTREE